MTGKHDPSRKRFNAGYRAYLHAQPYQQDAKLDWRTGWAVALCEHLTEQMEEARNEHSLPWACMVYLDSKDSK